MPYSRRVPFRQFVCLAVLALACSPAERPADSVASVASPRYGDSTTFDPDGYYLPMARVAVDGFRLDRVELQTLEYYYDGAIHYDRPRLLTPAARIAIASLGNDAASVHECQRMNVSRDSLRVSCANTPMGDVVVAVRLLDPRGRYWSLPDYDEQKREVARGEMRTTRAGAAPSIRQISLYFYAGD